MNTPEFLQLVRAFCAEHPEAAPHVASYAQAGIQEALDRAYERAADMEVALVAALSPRFKSARQVIHDKLKKWEGKTSCRWSWLTDEVKRTALKETP